MSENEKIDFETARAKLRQLPDTASRTRDELLLWIAEAECRMRDEQDHARRLAAENARLKRELGKLHLARTGVMSSRLKDALLE